MLGWCLCGPVYLRGNKRKLAGRRASLPRASGPQRLSAKASPIPGFSDGETEGFKLQGLPESSRMAALSLGSVGGTAKPWGRGRAGGESVHLRCEPGRLRAGLRSLAIFSLFPQLGSPGAWNLLEMCEPAGSGRREPRLGPRATVSIGWDMGGAGGRLSPFWDRRHPAYAWLSHPQVSLVVTSSAAPSAPRQQAENPSSSEPPPLPLQRLLQWAVPVPPVSLQPSPPKPHTPPSLEASLDAQGLGVPVRAVSWWPGSRGGTPAPAPGLSGWWGAAVQAGWGRWLRMATSLEPQVLEREPHTAAHPAGDEHVQDLRGHPALRPQLRADTRVIAAVTTPPRPQMLLVSNMCQPEQRDG